MREIKVRAAKPYSVLIGQGLLKQAGAALRRISGGTRCVIVSDSNVAPLYSETLKQSLSEAGFSVSVFVFPAGERSKNSDTYLSLLDHMASHELTRSDLVVALGGGVTGDMAGFAAATYLRGIDYAQIPTSLLAMVDSSVGGKTAIDLKSGKNYVGAFHQPKVVLCDTQLLATLPQEFFLDGCGEVLKYAVLGDPELFEILLRDGHQFPREDVIARCVAQKEDFVAADEFEKGRRQMLNLGHTLGHAIEAVSNFELSHGRAVAAGLCMIARASAKRGLCSVDVVEQIENAVNALGLPTGTDVPVAELLKIARGDKKRRNDSISCVVPRTIGTCELLTLSLADFEHFAEGASV
ncbi:MAG: 3-dehydroquinate synthase [Oscillospiraceae bacterium]|nr:3-dehydroquinate synthase [Oscillospiraceae bacterium]